MKPFIMTFYLGGAHSVKVCEAAESAYHHYRLGNGSRPVTDLLAPKGEWSFRPHSTKSEVIFSGVIYPGDEQNRKFFKNFRVTLKAFDNLAKVVGEAIYDELQHRGADEEAVARLLYMGRWHIIDLTPERA